MRGQIIGHAGGSLGASAQRWAVSRSAASIGRKGEQDTAKILNALAARETGPTVIHDLDAPTPGSQANIDHVVVAGTTVLIVDSKAWKPGFYYSISHLAFRGFFSRFTPAEKHTMGFLRSTLQDYLGDRATVITPLLAVWPSSRKGDVTLWALRIPGARAIRGTRLARRVKRALPNKPADPQIVMALARLAR
jgi:hypothetical protein